MSEIKTRGSAEDRIERLLRFAGPRPGAPVERSERVREQVRQNWRRSLTWRRRRRFVLWSGLAAAAALAAVVWLPGGVGRSVPTTKLAVTGPVAQVENVMGAVRFGQAHDEPGERGRLVRVGDVLQSGAVLETAERGRIAVRLPSGPSVRLDVASSLRFESPDVIALSGGRVYVDSDAATSAIEIRTPSGSVFDIGTQFEVRVHPEGVRVRVREGLIHLERAGESIEATAGTELEVDSGGEVYRRPVAVFGPAWDWVLDVAPPFSLEGSTLAGFLDWVGRETGWGVSFASHGIEASAPSVVLHGSLDGSRPDHSLDVLRTCGLTHRLENGTLYIEALPK